MPVIRRVRFDSHLKRFGPRDISRGSKQDRIFGKESARRPDLEITSRQCILERYSSCIRSANCDDTSRNTKCYTQVFQHIDADELGHSVNGWKRWYWWNTHSGITQ
jgi:hypothetical protein